MNEISPRASGLPDCSAYEGPDFPAKKKVLLLNDDFTTQDFVVAVLMLMEPHLSGTILIFAIGLIMMFVQAKGMSGNIRTILPPQSARRCGKLPKSAVSRSAVYWSNRTPEKQNEDYAEPTSAVAH